MARALKKGPTRAERVERGENHPEMGNLTMRRTADKTLTASPLKDEQMEPA